MSWGKLPIKLPGMDTWGAAVDGVSFVVSFDREHPELGYQASFKRCGSPTVYLHKPFPTKRAAQKAAIEAFESTIQ